ncbi:MAG: iron ABC transporter permease [Clostridiales bacterium]|jgi:iron complex transport system permease protein|nr:iron ABC transporter permease [Clostridiales bacterium]
MGNRMDNGKNGAVLLACLAALIFSAALALNLGAVRLTPSEVFQGLFGSPNDAARQIMLNVRLPRLLAGAMAGAALAVSGVILQTILSNPLAAPGIIGVNAGAGLFAAAAMALLPGAFWAVPVSAFLGALLTVLLVYGAARAAGASRTTLILSGVAVSSLMTAGINTLLSLYPDILRGLRDFQTGGFAGVSIRQLLPAGVVITIGLLTALFFGGELSVLSLGEDSARALGLNAGLFRFLFLGLAAALAGAAVSFSGLLGFIGLIVPHMAKLLLPNGGKRMFIGTSAIMGAAFLTLCDTAARTLFSPGELPVGVLAAYLGVPLFMWLLYRDRRRRRD